jgi:luciferase family oxidoreductase group 1
MLGLPFAFAHHFSAQNTIPALDLYRQTFRPSEVLAEPYALIGVSALATDEEGEARRQTRAMGLNMLRLRTGRPGLFPDPAEAERQELGPMEEDFIDSWSSNVVYGTADEVRAGLDELHKRTGANELMLTTHAHRGELRLRSYELIADAYRLPTA